MSTDDSSAADRGSGFSAGLGMRVGMRYVVTRSSDEREFQIGDRIWIDESGAIMNSHAGGWMPAEDVPAATKGMQIAPDEDWIAAMRTDLEKAIAVLCKHA